MSAPADAGSWWVRAIAGWHVAFAVVLVPAALLLVVAPGPRWPPAAAALVVLGGAYALSGAPGAHRRDGHARPYLLVLVLGLGTCLAADPRLSFLLFVAFPQVWLLTDGRREAVAWTLALGGSATVGLVVGSGAGAAPQIAASLAVSVAFSCAMGLWISAVIEQSRERAELIAQLESARAQLAAAHHAAGVAQERERLARDIHDTLAQGFTSVVLLAQGAAAGTGEDVTRDRLRCIEEAAREGLAQSRTLVAAMTPVELSGGGLEAALHRLAERVSRESGVQVVVESAEVPTGLPRTQEVVLLRAAQEALSNVRRHAAARTARVRLSAAAGGVALEVADDGVGVAADAEGSGRGFGLAGMRRRVEEAGGRLQLSAPPGGGTLLRVAVPGPHAPGAQVPPEGAS
ncbi:sensor histidine kinase [Kineococcus esterisolvens]|uniref:sensor histidine kinase n=1 Tax=unclassified Kineococcus TaxID=2621656 RepID=UPI003D7C6B26